jgi:hypothetical protein
MPYRYVMRWRKGESEALTIEAWPKTKELATKNEIRKPCFIIGKVRGPRTTMLWNLATEAAEKYPSIKKNGTIKVTFPIDDITAIADAYRLGLAAAVISRAQTEQLAESALKYIQHAPREEVWFWASKLLRLLGEGVDASRVAKALCIISGASSDSFGKATQPC